MISQGFSKKQHFRKTNFGEHRVLDNDTKNVETLLKCYCAS